MTVPVVGKVYHSAHPFRTDEEAAIFGPILESLAEQGKGQPQDIVEAARAADSPLHRYFTWDDSEAASKYRLEEARSLARSFRVEIIEVKDERPTTFTVPGLVSVRYADGKRGYETLRQIQSDEEKLQQTIAAAASQLSYWRRTFEQWRHVGDFQRFEPVFQALDAIAES